jgi:hypothetical protein
MIDTDIHETTLKYFRCLYLAEKMSSRPRVIFNVATRASCYTYNFSLQGMMNVSLGDLPDWERFGELWIAFLKKQKTNDIIDRLLREAVRLFEGKRGLEKLATQKGHEFPETYTDWLEALKKDGNTEEVLRAALLGLEKLPENLFIRAKIADYLHDAAVKLKRDDLILMCKREALFSDPTLNRLLDFLDCSKSIDQRISFLNETLARFDSMKKRKNDSREHTFYIHRPSGLLENEVPNILELSAFLLKGDYARVAAFVKGAKPLGWTFMNNPIALAVPFFLYVCWDKEKALTFNIEKLWTRSTDLQPSYYEYIHGEDTETNTGVRFRSYIKDTLEKFPIDEHKKMENFSMAEKAAKRRIDAIVSGKHRKSYWKAAELLLAIAEIYWSNCEPEKGQLLIDNFKKQYNRYSAFQRELKTAVKESGLFSI